jgi:replicative DNA helicase
MVVLAARPSMWKTAFALNIAQNIWFKWRSIAIFSLEMSKEQLTDRMIASAMWIDAWKLSKWELEDEEFAKIWEAMEKLWKANIYMDDSAWWNLVDLKSKARRLSIESWLDLIIIDYLQLMTSWNSFNRVQEVSEISRWIKSLARELNVPVLALSQLSRAVESRPDKRPVLSDLRESWSIEQDADIVMMLYREDYYDEFTEKKWIAEIFIRKNRNGPTWNMELTFNKKNQKFFEIEKNLQESPF